MEAIWGALVGDACGATLEGLGSVTPERVEHALTLPGGGPMRVGPGQITDDGELTLTLYRALNESAVAEFPLGAVARAYGAWYDSCPFDIGRTCSMAFEQFSEEYSTCATLEEALAEIKDISATSEANGAMMRATPIAVWSAAHPLQTAEYAEYAEYTARRAAVFAEQDASLSHPSAVTCQANVVYVYALTHLLLGTAVSEVVRLVDSYESNTTVKAWIEESKGNWEDLSNAQLAIGHVRHAFVMALWFLRHPEIGYREALSMVLLKGGDTDTNAAIVGGAVACYQPIPAEMKEKVGLFDPTIRGRWHIRPKEYVPKYVLKNQ